MNISPARRWRNFLKITKALYKQRTSAEFVAGYWKNFGLLKSTDPRFHIDLDFYDNSRAHPKNFEDFECAFASRQIARLNPTHLLDIGSYRRWLIGIMGARSLTTLDVRERVPEFSNENVIVCDASTIPVPDGSFDMVTSLCAIEHFGLGRYGDEFDLVADKKSIAETFRVLRPGGRYVFSTTLTRSDPQIMFNAHRIYNLDMIHEVCSGFIPEEEQYYSFASNDICDYSQVTSKRRTYDVYLGCWIKPAESGG